MASLKELFGIDKVFKALNIVKRVGGIKAVLKQRYLMDFTRAGTLVGTDKAGNEYYEDNSYFIPRNRWIKYTDKVWLDYDASQVPPEWYGWLHHQTDIPPTVKPPVVHKWMLPHRETTSIYAGEQFIATTTTRPKITAWAPGQKKAENK